MARMRRSTLRPAPDPEYQQQDLIDIKDQQVEAAEKKGGVPAQEIKLMKQPSPELKKPRQSVAQKQRSSFNSMQNTPMNSRAIQDSSIEISHTSKASPTVRPRDLPPRLNNQAQSSEQLKVNEGNEEAADRYAIPEMLKKPEEERKQPQTGQSGPPRQPPLPKTSSYQQKGEVE